MKRMTRSPFLVLSALLLSVGAGWSQNSKGPILQVKFEGEVAAGTPFSEVAGPQGATLKAYQQGVDPKSPGEAGLQQTVEVRKDPAMDGADFLRVVREPGARPAGLIVAPVAPGNSLAALTPLGADGVPKPSGAIDVFVRVNRLENPSDLTIIDFGKKNGMRVVLASGRPDKEGMIATLQALTGDKQIDSDLDGTPDTAQITCRGTAATMPDPDKIYHIAVTFDTDTQGVTTLKLFQKPGTGAIATDESSDLVAQARGALKGKFEAGLPETSFPFGSTSGNLSKTLAYTQDFANFRIYEGVPAVLPDIHDKAK